MKKLLLPLILLFALNIFVNKATAQILPDFGIRGGVNFASFSDSKQDIDSRRTGLLAGVYANISIPVIPVSIQPEVLYSQKGAEINGVEVKLSYIEIPVLARVDVAAAGPVAPHFYAGPYLGFNIDAEEDPEGDLEPAEDRVNDNDFGFTFGAGIDISKVNIGFRYSLGLEELFEGEELRNNTLSIVAGISF